MQPLINLVPDAAWEDRAAVPFWRRIIRGTAFVISATSLLFLGLARKLVILTGIAVAIFAIWFVREGRWSDAANTVGLMLWPVLVLLALWALGGLYRRVR
jgi:hypothetical protein